MFFSHKKIVWSVFREYRLAVNCSARFLKSNNNNNIDDDNNNKQTNNNTFDFLPKQAEQRVPADFLALSEFCLEIVVALF